MLHASRRAPRGFSLTELLFTVALIAIALALGLPALNDSLARTQLSTSLNQWMANLAQARIRAVSHGRNVILCPAAGEGCDDTTYWHRGWILFEDANRNAERDAGEALLQRGAADDSVRVTSSGGRQRIRYRPDGSSEGSNLTLLFCGRRGPSQARTIVLNNAGRARTGKATPEQAALACAAPMR